MILDKQEENDLAKFLFNVQELLVQVELEKSNVGMKIYDEANEWLVKLGK